MGRLAEEILTLRKEQSRRSTQSLTLADRVLPSSPHETDVDFGAFEEKLKDAEFFQTVVSETDLQHLTFIKKNTII